MRANDANYRRSNAITTVELDVTEDVCVLARRIRQESSETGHRQILAVALTDALCDAAAIDIVRKVTISDARQWHKKRNGKTVFKQYGYYVPKTRYLYITNRTAVRGQFLASGAFLTTLLHEWMHHYDTVKLELQSIHTAGFYSRLRTLSELLDG